MTEHAVYCIDSPSVETLATADHMAGWLLCSKEIDSLEAHLPDGAPCAIDFGLLRPDVAESFPPYPEAGRSGFRLDFPAGSLAETPGVRLSLAVKGSFGRTRRRRRTSRSSKRSSPTATVALCRPGRGLSPRDSARGRYGARRRRPSPRRTASVLSRKPSSTTPRRCSPARGTRATSDA